jgi:hypothetical protein
VGATGATGPAGSPDTAAQVLAKFNAATAGGASTILGPVGYDRPDHDLRWGMLHAAAGAACAPGGFQVDVLGLVVPKPVNVTCATACQNNTGADAPMTCRQAMGIAVGQQTRAMLNTNIAGYKFYSCADATASGVDETTATGPNDFIPFCCCYK